MTLTVTTAGGSDSETKDGYVVVSCPTPDPTFTSDVTSGPAPLDVIFTSTTEAPATGCDPTAWSWTFGDSGTGSGEVVAHTYTDDGLYDVCLTVTVPGTSAQTCVVDYIDVGGGCASGNLCLTLLLAGYWDGTEQSTEAYLTVDFYADPEGAPSVPDHECTARSRRHGGPRPDGAGRGAGRLLRGRPTAKPPRSDERRVR